MEFITGLIVTLALAAVLAFVANVVDDIRKKGKAIKGRISFRETMDLTDLPIITFMNNGKKLNFLLDSGASYSSINEKALRGLKYEKTEEVGTHYGIEGELVESRYIQMNVEYANSNYLENFQVVDLSKAFNQMKAETGVNLHGILGNSFFTRYKYILDFDELTAYSIM